MAMTLPAGLDQQRRLGPRWADWLDRLPRRLADLLQEWALTRDGEQLWHGYCSLVVPVRGTDGTRAVLKIAFDGDEESRHEALVLQHWHGHGAVRLLRADPNRRALLLERLHRRDLTGVPDLAACAVVADLYPRLHRPAPPQLATLPACAARWLDDLAAQPRDVPLPLRLRDQALGLGRDLASDPASVGRIIHGDLHYQNVLAAPEPRAAGRGPWLAIDPKPMSGDPHYELAPMLWNRFAELGGNVRYGVRERFRVLIERSGLHEDRARAWVIVRMILNANWVLQDARAADRALSEGEQAWLTRCIAITKSVQD